MAHPLVATGARYSWLGFATGAVGVGIGLAMGGPPGAAVFGLLGLGGGFFVWNGRALQQSGVAIPILQQSTQAILHGDLDAAERAPAALPPALAKKPMIARVVLNQRALIALMRGDATAAKELATESLALPPSGPFSRGWDAVRSAEAHALRALARAAGGDAAGTEEDARAIDASPLAQAPSIGRAELARAIILAKGGDKGALAEHLAKNGNVILENVLPRERSLTRALRALARAPGKSVYREAAKPDDETEAGRVATWIQQVAPDAAGFAPREVFVDVDVPPPQATPEAFRATSAARENAVTVGRKQKRKLTILLWFMLSVLGLLLWQYLSIPRDVRLEEASGASQLPMLLPILALGAFLPLWLRRYGTQQRKLSLAARKIALGDSADVTTDLRRLAAGRFPALAANAQLYLAVQANRDGRFVDAMNEADKGLAICHRQATVYALTADMVAPGLISERALALAAMDRFAEAETELAQLTHAHPGYLLLAQASFRVRLVTAVRKGDTKLAGRIAMSRRPELPIDLKTDLLADVALAASGEPMAADERDRIATELRAMPEVNAWVERIAPSARGARVAEPTLDKDDGEGEGEGESRNDILRA